MDPYQEFKKCFLFSWSAKKWQSRFEALTPSQQQAVISLLTPNMVTEEVFKAVEAAEAADLLLHFEDTVEKIRMEYLSNYAV